jgi:hypothetical protein
MLFMPLLCWGQNNDLAELQRVRFASSNADGWVKIKKDPPNDATFISEMEYTDAWVKSPESKLPVAYISGNNASIIPWFLLSATASAACSLPIGNQGAMQMYVKAIWNGIDIGQRMLVKDGTQFWTSQLPFYVDFEPNIVLAFTKETPYVITWFATFNPDDTNSWKNVGISENPLYVLRAQKTVGADAEYYYTSVHISCVGANGLGGGVDGEKNVVNGIFSDFQDLKVSKVGLGEISMNYWGSGSSTSTSVKDFLAFRNGQCGAWARFFQDLLELHGIVGNRIRITYKNDQLMPTQFENSLMTDAGTFFGTDDLPKLKNYQGLVKGIILVKNWNVIQRKFYMLDIIQSPPPLVNLNTVNHADDTGVRAQGEDNDNPQSWFGNHIIVEYGSKYYDPSYGKIFISKDDWEVSSLDGLGAKLLYQDLDAINPIDIDRRIIWISEKPLINIVKTDFQPDPN